MWQEKPQWTWCKNHGFPGFIFALTKKIENFRTDTFTFTPTSPKCFVKAHNRHFQDDEAQFGEWPHICAVLKWVHALSL